MVYVYEVFGAPSVLQLDYRARQRVSWYHEFDCVPMRGNSTKSLAALSICWQSDKHVARRLQGCIPTVQQ